MTFIPKLLPQVKSVVHLLLSNLDTPSQQVQEAISSCLHPLATVVKDTAQDIVKKLMEKVSLFALYQIQLTTHIAPCVHVYMHVHCTNMHAQ